MRRVPSSEKGLWPLASRKILRQIGGIHPRGVVMIVRSRRIVLGALAMLITTTGAARAEMTESAYLADRDKAIAQIENLVKGKNGQDKAQQAEEKALAALQKDLNTLIGPPPTREFFGEGKISLDTLQPGDVGFGGLDALRFKAGDNADVLVTTKGLAEAWLAHARVKSEGKLPIKLNEALRDAEFYTFAVSPDAAFTKAADLPLNAPEGAEFFVAQLGGFAQDIGPNPSQQIVLTIIKGGRLNILTVTPKTALATIPACDEIWRQAEAKSQKLQEAYRASGLKNEKLFEDSTKVEDQGSKDYYACFNRLASQQGFFPPLMKEAQVWADRLVGK
jgi:hypothetical protein